MRLATLMALYLASSGCAAHPASQPPSPRRAQYIEAEYLPYERSGTGIISGQVFMRTRGGDVKVRAGSEVFLNPVTTYSTEWWQRDVFDGERLAEADPRTDATWRHIKADGDGRFSFDSLPPGRYFVTSLVTWEYYRPGANQVAGGRVGQRVTLAEGQRVNVALDELKDRDTEGEGDRPRPRP